MIEFLAGKNLLAWMKRPEEPLHLYKRSCVAINVWTLSTFPSLSLWNLDSAEATTSSSPVSLLLSMAISGLEVYIYLSYS